MTLNPAHRLAVAPMMDCTDRHCRAFHRLLAPKAMPYTEMVTADAIIHGDRPRLLSGHHQDDTDPLHLGDTDPLHLGGSDPAITLQLGGSDPSKLAEAVRLAAPFHYAEYNLNVGCPSDRVQSGRFGACLMAEPALVRDCLMAMQEAAASQHTVAFQHTTPQHTASQDTTKGRPVSLKCRLGIDDMDTSSALDDFIGTVAESGITHIIIHARKAWLKGLSPRENRTIPPLDHGRVRRLAADFPALNFSINGGISTVDQAVGMLQDFNEPPAGVFTETPAEPPAGAFAGVMVGRAAYQQPYTLARMAAAIHRHPCANRFDVARRMAAYIRAHNAYIRAHGEVRPFTITRHMLGLMAGLPGAKGWRRMLTEDMRALAGDEQTMTGDDASSRAADLILYATERIEAALAARIAA